jgi:hypothetical protein
MPIWVVNNLQIGRQPGLAGWPSSADCLPCCVTPGIVSRFIWPVAQEFHFARSNYARAFLGRGKNPVV